MIRHGIIIGSLALAFASASVSAGTVSGRVVDHAGRGLADASVDMTGGTERRGAVTDSLGYFSVPDLPAGMWRIRVTILGFYIDEHDSVVVTSSGMTTDNFVLDEVPMNVPPDTLGHGASHEDSKPIPTSLTVQYGTLYFRGTRFSAPFQLSFDDSGVLLEGRRVPEAAFAIRKFPTETLSRRDTLYAELDWAALDIEVDGARKGLTRLAILQKMLELFRASPLVSDVQLRRGYLLITYYDIPKPRTVTLSNPIVIPPDSATVRRGRKTASYNRMVMIRGAMRGGRLLVINADTCIFVPRERTDEVDRALQSLQLHHRVSEEQKRTLEDCLPPSLLAEFDQKRGLPVK